MTHAPQVIDAHVHVGTRKYRPVEDFRADMDRHGMRRAVLVQFLGNTDNRYLETVIAADPDRFAGIGLVDPGDIDAAAQVRTIAKRGLFRGIRLPATARSAGPDPLLVWRLIAENGLVASVHGAFQPVVDGAFCDLLEALPDLHVRLEHLGGVMMGSEPPPYDRFRRFLELAARPNTTTTWSGFFLNAATPYPYPDADPFLRMTLEAFGADRIMWSGDWNRPDLGETDYAAAIAQVTSHAPFLDAEQRSWILGGAAGAVFWNGTQR